MTAQAREILIINGKEEAMASEPLKDYLIQHKDIKFTWANTSCWRGYYGKWKLEEGKLFLIDLEANIPIEENESKPVDLNYLFPGKTKVFASWYNGTIKIESGKLLKYVHSGYESIYQKELFLFFENGIKVKEYSRMNS